MFHTKSTHNTTLFFRILIGFSMVVNPIFWTDHPMDGLSQVHGIVGKGHPLAMMQTSSLMEVGFLSMRQRLADDRNIWKMTLKKKKV